MAECVSDHLIGDDTPVPGLGETSQSFDAACCLVESSHEQTLPPLPPEEPLGLGW
jgi:hypothetical protein